MIVLYNNSPGEHVYTLLCAVVEQYKLARVSPCNCVFNWRKFPTPKISGQYLMSKPDSRHTLHVISRKDFAQSAVASLLQWIMADKAVAARSLFRK
jgi:hypothetical protein